MWATRPGPGFWGRLVLGACALVALSGPASAQQPAAAARPAGPAAPAAPDPAATPHRDFPGGVVGLMDITYARQNGFRPQKLDIYMATPKPAAPRPLVIWLHGGGWAAGDQRGGGIATAAYRNWPAVLAGSAGRGYVVAAVSYRFTNEAKYPAQIQDVKAAVRWLRANAATYGIDPNRVVVWGASAGGHLANLLGTTCNVPELEGKPDRGAETSSCVQGVVDFYGPSDMAQADAEKLPGPPSPLGVVSEVAPVYLGCEFKACPPNQLRLANPIAFVKPSDPPFLIVHGTNDHSVPPAQSQILYDALQKAGVKAKLVMVPNVDHVFQGVNDAQGKEILDQVYAFLDATTGVKPAG